MFKINYLVFVCLIFLILGGCSDKTIEGENDELAVSHELDGPVIQGFLETSDFEKIAYTYVDADSKEVVILLHMLNGKKEDWASFQNELFERGISSISIDLRGHGQSQEFGSWKSFEKEDFVLMEQDVDSTVEYLKEKKHSSISIVGASIGANIAVMASRDYEFNKMILISPGLDYKGIQPESVMASLDPDSVILVAGKSDTYSYESAVELSNTDPPLQTLIYESSEHGTRLLKNSQISEDLLVFLEK